MMSARFQRLTTSLIRANNHGSIYRTTRPSLLPSQNNKNQCHQSRTFAKVSALSLTSKRRHGHKITMVTAYDYPAAIHVARAGIDVILVGDSVAMVELGHETTQPVTMDDMIHHCAAVKRGVDFAQAPDRPLLVGDMPFGSYEYEDTDLALRNAYRFVQEAGMDSVKLEVRRLVLSWVGVVSQTLLPSPWTGEGVVEQSNVCFTKLTHNPRILLFFVNHSLLLIRAAASPAPAPPASWSTAASPSWATWA
jgi:hypothetical protein